MKVEILSIGDELLIGETVNTNAAFIAQKLTDLGISIPWISTIGDDRECLLEAITTAEKRADIVIVTGGLGPTHDDITKKVFAEYFNSELILDEKIMESLRERFRKRNIPMANSNKEQALIPHNAQIIRNEVGTASGLLFEKVGKYFFVLPGVPAEMKFMMNSFVVPFLKTKTTTFYKKRIIHTAGLPESTLFEQLGNVDELEQTAKIAFLPTNGGVDIRISKIGSSEKKCKMCVAQVEKVFQQKFDRYIWGKDSETLEEKIAEILVQQKKTISLIEVGINGALAARFSNSPTAQKALHQAITFGSMDSLIIHFQLTSDMLEPDGFVSKQGVKEVALALRTASSSDIGLVIIHEEGREKTTKICFSDARETLCEQFVFNLTPSINLHRIVTMALKLLYGHLTGQKIS